MKSSLVFVFLLGFFAVAYSAVSSGFFKDPDHPGMCAIRPDFIVPPGIHKDPEDCLRVICGESGMAELQTCGVEIPPPGCSLGEPKDPKANYPDCCYKEIIC